jgi:hypothetical protein
MTFDFRTGVFFANRVLVTTYDVIVTLPNLGPNARVNQ